MYRGISQLKTDGKGRVALPTRYREELLGRCQGSLVITINNTSKHCLWLYPLDEWERVEEKVNALSSFKQQHIDLKRYFIGHACDVDMDKTGRILIPTSLREFARIDRQTYFVGQGNKFELWSDKDWEASCENWLSTPAQEQEPTSEMEQMQL